MPSALPPGSPPSPRGGLTLESTEMFKLESMVILITAGRRQKECRSCQPSSCLLFPVATVEASVNVLQFWGAITHKDTHGKPRQLRLLTQKIQDRLWVEGWRYLQPSMRVCVCARTCVHVFSKATFTTDTSVAAHANPLISVHLNLTTHTSIFSQSCD